MSDVDAVIERVGASPQALIYLARTTLIPRSGANRVDLWAWLENP